jgi:hypothetical protein
MTTTVTECYSVDWQSIGENVATSFAVDRFNNDILDGYFSDGTLHRPWCTTWQSHSIDDAEDVAVLK